MSLENKSGETSVRCLGSAVARRLFSRAPLKSPEVEVGARCRARLSDSIYPKKPAGMCVFSEPELCEVGAGAGSPPAQCRGLSPKAWGPPVLPPLLWPCCWTPWSMGHLCPGSRAVEEAGGAREPGQRTLYGAATGRSPLVLPSFSPRIEWPARSLAACRLSQRGFLSGLFSAGRYY